MCSKQDSWVVAACEMKIPVYTPGWEDSSLGNTFTAKVMDGTIKHHGVIKSGTMQMAHLVDWYLENQSQGPLGFFQIGGGIAGDFAICEIVRKPDILLEKFGLSRAGAQRSRSAGEDFFE